MQDISLDLLMRRNCLVSHVREICYCLPTNAFEENRNEIIFQKKAMVYDTDRDGMGRH